MVVRGLQGGRSDHAARRSVDGAAKAREPPGHEPDYRTRDQILGLFRAWDEDGDGKISREELTRFMRFVTEGNITEDMLDRLMASADKNGDGKIEMEEFIAWLFNPKTGMMSRDVAPSKIPAAKSPALVHALQEWYALYDVNTSGGIDFQEFAIAQLLCKEDAKIEDIEEDFRRLDRSGRRLVTWPEFMAEYCRLLDGIPRPLEEKIELIRHRASRLSEAINRTHEASERAPRLITSAPEFLALLQERYGSLAAAFQALDEDSSGVLSIVEVRAGLERLLDLEPGTHVALQCVRTLFRELDLSRDGAISLEELEAALAKNRRRSTRIGGKRCSVSEVPAGEEARKAKDERAPLDEAVELVVTLLAERHWAMQCASLKAQIEATDPENREKLAQLHEKMSGLERQSPKLRGKEATYQFWAMDAVDAQRVTPAEFERMVLAGLSQDPAFRRGCEAHGNERALRKALLGWEVKDIFEWFSKGRGDGTISVAELDNWLKLRGAAREPSPEAGGE